MGEINLGYREVMLDSFFILLNYIVGFCFKIVILYYFLIFFIYIGFMDIWIYGILYIILDII